ncbi:MAG: leucine-rich repeat domain-containing protein [Verrucomicrobiales bacterium]|nr:leucine-rich repeat domain-containing protein [Verrucomicrobiales bacterium]
MTLLPASFHQTSTATPRRGPSAAPWRSSHLVQPGLAARHGSALLCLVAILAAKGEILVNESFTHPNGPIIETAAAQWRNLTGTPGEIRTANGALRLQEGEFEIVETPLPGEPREEGTLYAGFTVTVSALPSGIGSDFAAFSAANGPRTLGRVFATTTTAGPGKFRIGVSTALGVTSANLYVQGIFPEDLSLDTSYRVVVRLTLPNLGATLWINPASEQSASATGPEGTFPGAIAAYAFRQRLFNGNGMGTVTVDDLVVATTFAEARGGQVAEPQWTFTTASAGTITITGYTGGGAHVTVPETINGMPVTRIANGAFRGKTDLQTMTLPSGLIAIGSQAFSMSGLTSISIPDGVVAIEAETFTRCSNLTHVTLPPTLLSIAAQAFAWTGLTEISIPTSVTTLHSAALMFCTNLTAIRVEEAHPNFASVDGVLLNKDLSTLRIYPAGRPGEYEIPESVRRIEDTAFSGAIHPKTLVIPDTVTSLGSGAFQDCTGLTSVRIGRGITVLPQAVFSACTSLREVRLPDTLQTISGLAFSWCRDLRSITIPASVRTFGGGAFSHYPYYEGERPSAIASIYFEGDAPAISGILGQFPFPLEEDEEPDEWDFGPTVYFRAGTTGWGARFGGRPTRLWDPRVAFDASFGVKEGRLGFTLAGAPGLVIVVETTTDLNHPVWTFVTTLTLTDGQAVFHDPDPAGGLVRLYRFRSP